MKIIDTPVNGVYILEAERYHDDRGCFSELYNRKTLLELGIDFEIAQVNFSQNTKVGVLRGLHYQAEPYSQAKIVYCLRGQIVDCTVDINRDSSTYGKYFMCQLTEGGNRALYLAPGLAHGYKTLAIKSEVVYLTSNYYNKHSERGIRYNDPFFSIIWPCTPIDIIDNRDRTWPLWQK